MNKQRAELRSEAETIMLAGGFATARAEHLGPFWRVCGELPDKNEHSGTTAHQVDPQDPRALARALVALAAKPVEFEEIAEAPETVEPTFAPGEDPLDVPPEPEHDSAHEGDGETGEEADGAVQVLDADSVSEDGAGDNPLGEWFDYETTGDAGGGGGDVPLDADFADFADLPELGQEIAEEHPEEIGPIAYGASTVDALVREKMGRLSQLARQYKAELQVGWTLDEFRSLQGLMVRMERGEAQNDAASRERYFWISARSRAMSSVDEHRDKREAILEEIGARRDFNAAVEFDPEANWP